MSEKKFLSLDKQIEHLNIDKKIKCGPKDKINLIRIGYFNLVNGYKTPFTSSQDSNGNHIYSKGTTINELVSLKSFDDDLRYLLLRAITKVEEELRTVFSYIFELNNIKKVSWKSPKAYSPTVDNTEVQKMVSGIEEQIQKEEM